MTRTENLPWGWLLIILLCLPISSNSQVYTPDPIHYQGRLDNAPVELLVEYIQDAPLVLLQWTQQEEVYRLRRQGQSVLFKEYTLFDNRPTRRQWQLDIEKNQVRITDGDGRTTILKATPLKSTPESITAIRRTRSASQLAFFQLCRQFTGIRYDILNYGESAVARALRFTADDITFLQRPVNVLASNAPELVIELRIASYIHVVRVFRRNGSSWQLLPSALFFKRNTRDAEPCLTEPPGPAYFYYDFVEALRSGESVVYGYTYDGNCTNIYRGDDIFFYVWQVTAKGFHELFRAPVRQYWYASPDPAPIAQPVYQEFDFVHSSENQPYPRRLRKREAIFAWPEGVRPGTTMEPVDFRTAYITLF